MVRSTPKLDLTPELTELRETLKSIENEYYSIIPQLQQDVCVKRQDKDTEVSLLEKELGEVRDRLVQLQDSGRVEMDTREDTYVVSSI